MKYYSLLPFTALCAIGLIGFLVGQGLIPPGMQLLEGMQTEFRDGIYLIIFLIILLESIIYVGFYFPGQFFAVILVVGANPNAKDIGMLTIAMVLAATIGSAINYALGYFSKSKEENDTSPIKIRNLLLAMIHINSLAFFMFSQGANQKPFKIVGLAGLFNLPYYLALIAGTAVLSEQVMQMAENTYMLVSVISIWLVFALYFDYRKHTKQEVQV